jgi:serine phosphatase RsbU (regulator of sigma subunit)
MTLVELGLELRLAGAKVGRYATSESGDTLELVERPKGGISVVLADGQTSGRGAKAISNLVAKKVVALLGEGVRDGAAARAASDYLFTLRQGKVSSDLIILSVDLATRTVVLSRNTGAPALIIDAGAIRWIVDPVAPVGLHARTRPSVIEMPISAGLRVVALTDGLSDAGRQSGHSMNVRRQVEDWLSHGGGCARMLADSLLARGIELDSGRPGDDMSVIVMGLVPNEREDKVQTVGARVPI